MRPVQKTLNLSYWNEPLLQLFTDWDQNGDEPVLLAELILQGRVVSAIPDLESWLVYDRVSASVSRVIESYIFDQYERELDL